MRKFLFFLVVLLLFASGPEAQVIKISVQKGQKYLLETGSIMSDSSEIGGQSLKTTVEYKNFSVYEVTTTGKTETVFQVTTTRIISKTAISGIMEMEQMNDSDTDKEDSISKMPSKIGKTRKVFVDNDGYMVKQDNNEKTYTDTTEKYENPMKGWDFSRSKAPADLYVPLFIGKELKPGASFPYLDSSTVEKNTTSFSIHKEKMDTRDSGTYTITGIENGIASISYSGIRIFSMLMNIMDKPTNSISKSFVKAQLQIDMNTGMLMSKITEEDATIYSGDNNKSRESTSKSTNTIKVKLIQ